MGNKFDIIVSTGSPQTDGVGIMGIVHRYHPQQFTKQFFGRDMDHDEIVYELIRRLVEDAQKLGANAIYNLRIDMLPAPGAMAATVMFNVYGTAVRTN